MKKIRRFLIASLAMVSMAALTVSCIVDDDENENESSNNDQKDPSKDDSNHKDLSGIDANGHEYIDLDLPSGTLWASCNIGATKPEDFGDYFAWGEIESKEIYDGSTYKWGEDTYTKYNSEDGLTQLQQEDDVAIVEWGSEWRMPIADEIEELLNNCDYTWTEVNGVKGARLTGPNGNSVFFPASGLLYDEDVYYVGDKVFCLSSTLKVEGGDQVSSAYFDELNRDYTVAFRENGVTVRAVRATNN